jgi:polyhydroxyalkanoate synthesis regulator phasin
MKLALGLAVLTATVTGLVDAPTAAAKARTLTGQVMTAPYASGKQVVVPVLVDRKSLKRAKLRAPVGVLLLKGAKKVKVVGQRARVAPALLRAGDKLRARAKVTKSLRRASYWRTPVRSFKVTKRAPTFSPAELQALLVAFGGDVRRLDAALDAVAKYVQAGFQKVDGDLAALRGNVQSLAAALTALEQRVAALEAGLPALEARMQAQLDALAQQFGALGTQLAAMQTQLAGLDGDVSALEADVAAIESQLAQMTADIAEIQTAMSALCNPPSPVAAVC